MRNIATYIIVLLWAATCRTAMAQVAGKAAADSAYMRNDYPAAIQIYESLLQEGEAAEVYYNLGNSYFKNDEIGRAILNYERAWLLSPGNGDIRANLEIARSRAVDKIPLVSELFFVTWMNSLINLQSVDGWGRWGIALFVVFLISLAVYLFAPRTLHRKVGFAVAGLSLLLCLAANSFASAHKNRLLRRSEAIVLSPSVTVRSTPDENGTSLFIIHEGRKVTVKDETMREWREVEIEDGKKGWVRTQDIEKI